MFLYTVYYFTDIYSFLPHNSYWIILFFVCFRAFSIFFSLCFIIYIFSNSAAYYRSINDNYSMSVIYVYFVPKSQFLSWPLGGSRVH